MVRTGGGDVAVMRAVASAGQGMEHVSERAAGRQADD